MRPGRGYSSIELMIVALVLATLAYSAVPYARNLILANEITTSTNLLLAHLQFARSRAIMATATIVVCPSLDGQRCEPSNRAWSHGWLVFKDKDFKQPPRLDPEDELILSHQNESSAPRLYSSLDHVRFSENGTARNGTITLCHESADPAQARAIIISILGRSRVSKTTASGAPLTCGHPK